MGPRGNPPDPEAATLGQAMMLRGSSGWTMRENIPLKEAAEELARKEPSAGVGTRGTAGTAGVGTAGHADTVGARGPAAEIVPAEPASLGEILAVPVRIHDFYSFENV